MLSKFLFKLIQLFLFSVCRDIINVPNARLPSIPSIHLIPNYVSNGHTSSQQQSSYQNTLSSSHNGGSVLQGQNSQVENIIPYPSGSTKITQIKHEQVEEEKKVYTNGGSGSRLVPINIDRESLEVSREGCFWPPTTTVRSICTGTAR